MMRKLIFLFTYLGISVLGNAQVKLPKALPNVAQAVQGLKSLGQGMESGPSIEEIGAGLKEALDAGVATGVSQLSRVGGFAENLLYRIPLPPEIQSVEEKIRKNPLLNAGIGPKLDGLIAAMNQGAEVAVKEATPIFKEAITDMTIKDALGILQGGDGAATAYLRQETSDGIQAAFAPIIEAALKTVDAGRYWTPLIQAVNANKKVLGLTEDIEPDLPTYVNARAREAMYKEIGIQEQKIRKDPLARTSALLKSVFGSKIAQG